MMRLDRLSWIIVIFMAVWIVLLCRTFQIQILQREKYTEIANLQARDRVIKKAPRGRILDRNGKVLAQSIQEKNGDGKLETRRIYPQGVLASQLIGQVGRDGQGLFGLEYLYENRFRGTDGWQSRILNRDRQIQAGRKMEGREPIPGEDLYLTIDRDIQEIVEKALKEGVEEFRAKSGSAVIVDPQTGEVLAMASYPTFDPNAPVSAATRAKRNDIISLVFEPGSTFKLVTAATAIETKSVHSGTVFSGEKGKWNAGNGITIHDDGGRDHGDHDMTGAMAVSSNIIFAKIADSIGDKKFYRYMRSFGFGTKTQIELPGEESGYLKPVNKWSGRSGKTMGYGHEISVTAMQMVMAFCTIANGGDLMQPTLVKKWGNFDGKILEENRPVKVRNVVSKETAAQVRRMLREVVEKGTGKQVNSQKLPDIAFGGKTGTAEKYNASIGKYDKTKQVASFIGLAPAENPRYVCMVFVDEPEVKTAGGATSGPIFRKIMEGIYFLPAVSPRPYNLKSITMNDRCNTEFVGLSRNAAKVLADSLNCEVTFAGEGITVVASERDFETMGRTLHLGTLERQKMPDLKGLSLRDALVQLGKLSGTVEYEGVGRVKKQTPKANAEIKHGEKFNLVLSENG